MRKTLFIMTLLLVGLTIGTAQAKYKYSKNRTVSKSFSVGIGATLENNISYADVIVTTVPGNTIQVRMEINTYSNDEQRAEKMLDVAVYEMNKSTGNGVYVYGALNSELTNNQGNWGNFDIKYYISVPSGTKFNSTIKYGNMNMDKTEHGLILNMKYGNLRVMGNASSATTLDVQYGDINIGNITDNASINLRYCNVRISNCKSINLVTAYSNVSIENADNIKGTSRYDKYTIGKLNDIIFESAAYGEYKIGLLRQKLSMTGLRYSNLRVKDVSPNFNSIYIPDAAYADISFVIPNGSFKVDARTKYATVKIYDISAEGAIITNVGDNPRSTIKIENRYGNISVSK